MKKQTRKRAKKRMPLAKEVMSDELAEEEKAIIEGVISDRVKHLDRLLEENIEKILSKVDGLILTEEKWGEAILLAKEVYFRG